MVAGPPERQAKQLIARKSATPAVEPKSKTLQYALQLCQGLGQASFRLLTAESQMMITVVGLHLPTKDNDTRFLGVVCDWRMRAEREGVNA